MFTLPFCYYKHTLSWRSVCCCAFLQVSAVAGAVSLGFMKRDMDSTAQHVASETEQGGIQARSTAAATAASSGGRREGFKSPMLQVPGGEGVQLVQCCAVLSCSGNVCLLIL
jgi:hypothetical protein